MKRPGFTLLEVLLALALTVVVLGLLGMAVDVHLRVTDASLNGVEESQWAKLLLRQMADDLRRAIPVTRAPSSIGCLRGNRRELQVDISRLPSLDGMQTTGSPPSDVRTITYFVAKPGDMESTDTGGSHEPRRGLLRGECERATFAWAVQQGQADELNRAMKVLSSEVETIEFTYISGGSAYQEWDSMEKGKLPTAVKIAVAIRQPKRKSQQSSVSGLLDERPSMIHKMLVDLPNSRATLDQAIAAVAEQSTSTSTQTPSSDSTKQEANSQGTGIKEIKPLGSSSGGSGK